MTLFSIPLLRASALALMVAAASVAHGFDQTHAAFDQLLKAQVQAGLVNYPALKAAPRPLDNYLAQLAAVPEAEFNGWSESERLAFLINLYNATTLKLIVSNYPVKSIRSIGWLPGSAWKQDTVQLFGKKIPLDDLEHGIIRQQYHDARVHFALVCAARGCPPLRTEAFVATQLDAQLQDQGRTFIGQLEKNRIDASKRIVYLSPIFKWFSGDFENEAGSVIKFVAPFFIEETRRALVGGDFAIEYTNYDWTLNDQAGK